MARPTKRSKALIDRLCEGLREGEYEKDMCEELNVDRTNLFRWKQGDKELRDLIWSARCDGIVSRLEKDRTKLETASDRNAILRAKELLAHSRWEAEKLLPKFQPVQKSEIEHKGPMILGWEDDPIAEVKRSPTAAADRKALN